MAENEISTINKFFSIDCTIKIPPYQRAYAWEERHCKQFLDDLVEQAKTDKYPYHLGQIILQIENDHLCVIDGQQRLTTAILFFATLVKIIKTRNMDIDKIKNIYLMGKFKTINEDRECFEKILSGDIITKPEIARYSHSQKNIYNAVKVFEREILLLEKRDKKIIEKLQKVLENALITKLYVKDPAEATQIFEYQNNRGVGLTEFEKIKAYLMHQIYLYSKETKEKTDDIISNIQNIVADIYRNIEMIDGYFTENELLINFCWLYYNIDSSCDDVKNWLFPDEDDKIVDNEIEVINKVLIFFHNFLKTCQKAKEIVANKKNHQIANIFLIDNRKINLKIVLLAIYLKGDEKEERVNKLFKLLEILCFKMNVSNKRAEYLGDCAYDYFQRVIDFDGLYKKIKEWTVNGFRPSDDFVNAIEIYLQENEKRNIDHYWKNYKEMTRYILWQYENYLRAKMARENKNIIPQFDRHFYNTYNEIEHIYPKNPEKSGKAFQNKYINCLGNLSLLTSRDNKKLQDKDPVTEKFEVYKKYSINKLIQYRAIINKKDWNKDEITKRFQDICIFVKKYFNENKLYLN